MFQIHLSQLTMSCADELYPALEQIPAMQRRRLSGISRMALNSAMLCLNHTHVDYIVWASQYGDEQKTIQILQDVLQDLTPSPTQFSTSVHNAVAGLYSILCQDATVSTSLCAPWSTALLEAYAYLKIHAPQGKALVVYYDEALPDIYQEYENFQGFAMAACVSLQNADLTIQSSAIQSANALPMYHQALDFYHDWQQLMPQQAKVWP